MHEGVWFEVLLHYGRLEAEFQHASHQAQSCDHVRYAWYYSSILFACFKWFQTLQRVPCVVVDFRRQTEQLE